MLELSSPSGLDWAQRTYRWNNPSTESHAKELVLLFQGFYLLIFGSHFLLQKHQHLKRPQSVLRDVVRKLQLFEREMKGSKSLQRCVNDDNDIKGSLTCISLLIINIHHPSASMHSVRASVHVPQSCRNCSFRAHISAAISSRSYLARLAFIRSKYIVHSGWCEFSPVC